MQEASHEKLLELQNIISKMPLYLICEAALPEFGVCWEDVARTIRHSKLPMTPSSIARILHLYVAKNLPEDDVVEIVNKLRLKLLAIQKRKWYVITLLEPLEEISVTELVGTLSQRVTRALLDKHIGRTMQSEVQTVKFNELLYMSVQLVSSVKRGQVLYVATPPGEPVALVSSLCSKLLLGCVEALGFKEFQNAKLSGQDIPSLLRIHSGAHENVDYLAESGAYNPVPVVTGNVIDFTNQAYNQQYVDNLLGPNPPSMTDLSIQVNTGYFDPSALRKKMNIKMSLKSEDVLKTLKSWANIGIIHPTSALFQVFSTKSNQLEYECDDFQEQSS